MMEESKRDELLREILAAKIEWEKTSVLITPEDQEKPILDGWSVKDVIAHLMWHENEMLSLVRAKRLVGSELWQRPLQERNRLIWEQYREKPVGEVREEARNVHEALFKELETVSDEDLTEPGRWPDMPPDWTLWQLLEDNTFEHYRDHIQDLKRYLASRGESAEIAPE